MSAVVITGASGFLGRHLLAHYLGEERDVIALTRDRRHLEDVKHPRLRVEEVDYGGAVDIPPSSTVIYCAALRNAPRASASGFTRANVTEPENIARVAMRNQVRRFIHLGTTMVYGPSDIPLDETAPMMPDNPYAQSKRDGILALERLAADGLPLVTLLPSIIYGTDFPNARSRSTSHMRRVLAKPFRINVNAPARNLVFVDDVVRAIARAESDGQPGARYVIAGEDTTPEHFERAVFAAADRRPTPKILVPRVVAMVAAGAIDAILGYDVGSGWRARVRTMFAPWCFRSGRAIQDLDHKATPLAEGVRRTVATL